MIRIGWYIIHKHSHDLPQKKKKLEHCHSITNLPQWHTATRRSRPVRWPRDVRATAWLCVSVEPASWNAFSIQQYTTYCISCILRIVGDVGGNVEENRRSQQWRGGKGGEGERREKKRRALKKGSVWCCFRTARGTPSPCVGSWQTDEREKRSGWAPSARPPAP